MHRGRWTYEQEVVLGFTRDVTSASTTYAQQCNTLMSFLQQYCPFIVTLINALMTEASLMSRWYESLVILIHTQLVLFTHARHVLHSFCVPSLATIISLRKINSFVLDVPITYSVILIHNRDFTRSCRRAQHLFDIRPSSLSTVLGLARVDRTDFFAEKRIWN